MFDGFEKGRVVVDGVGIAYVAAGDGPPVLMLHGFPQTHALWAQVAPHLVQAGYRVICTDLRGYGASDKPAAAPDLSNYGFRAMAADQLGLMRALGHRRFHLVGHDRGARTAHRLALDAPGAVASVTLMDIVPTHTLLTGLTQALATAYWHWFYLAQPAPFPERMIGADPDHFFETCLLGWGAARLADFDADQMAAYRAAWRDPANIAGACNDYRAALAVDLADDRADLDARIVAPALVLYGASGAMARLYDVPGTWRDKCRHMEVAAMPGGHFFIDEDPGAVAARLTDFLAAHPLRDAASENTANADDSA